MTRLLTGKTLESRARVVIIGAELHYLTHVRRHVVGDMVEIQDDRGRVFEASIITIDPDGAKLDIGDPVGEAAGNYPVTLILAVPKHSLMDDIIRKASELGVETVVPVIANRSVVIPRDAKLSRWRKIAGESRRQCLRKTPLKVSDMLPLETALRNVPKTGTRIILDPVAPSDRPLWTGKHNDPPITAVIGPEGGFTDEERSLAKTLDFHPVSLGATILRVETAAITTAVLAIAMLGGFGPIEN